ncbi:hypothetical protein [Streptomyces sp. 7N604]|uniref:hypothetical protein n=1 Tax=Streptomyces sp. 7N604 TaxID=3457415 RepID=UPI003FD6A873
MHEHLVALEGHMQQLQQAIRQALAQDDAAQTSILGEELKRTQRAWNVLCGLGDDPDTAQPEPAPPAAVEPGQGGLPVRDQVHQALTLLTVPAAPKLLSQVHQAFFSGPLNTARLTTLRRDEERSFRSGPYARAYYICPALTSDLLSPARALLALSTWPLEQRLVGPPPNESTSSPRLCGLRTPPNASSPTPSCRSPSSSFSCATAATSTATLPGARSTWTRCAGPRQPSWLSTPATTRTPAPRRPGVRQQLGEVEQIFGETLRKTAR